MGRISHNGEQHGNGFSVEEAIVYESGTVCPDLVDKPDRFSIELVLDSYVEKDIPSNNKVEYFVFSRYCATSSLSRR